MTCGGCQSLAAEMDRMGPEWCLENIDDLSKRVQANAKENGVNVPLFAIRSAIRYAVWKSKREG